jgi:hypothetical protein
MRSGFWACDLAVDRSALASSRAIGYLLFIAEPPIHLEI